MLDKDPSQIVHVFEDFNNVPVFASTTSQNGWYTYQDTGVTMQGSPTEMGVLEVAGNATDNDEGILTSGGNLAGSFKISTTDGSKFMVGFEARLKKASIADNALAFFIGLGEEGLAAANTLVDDTGAVADKDHIGFHVDHAAGETLDAVYGKESGTQKVNVAGVDTLVADTYVKVGFLYNPSAPAAKKIAWFINGKEQSTYVTNTLLTTAADFPAGEELALLFATKVGAAAEVKAQLDWWGAFMLLCEQ